MKEHIRKISFLIDKNELKLLEEACLYGADANRVIKNAVSENEKLRLEFYYEDLDDLADYIAHCANHEKSESKQRKWDKLYDKISNLLELSEDIHHDRKEDIFCVGLCTEWHISLSL